MSRIAIDDIVAPLPRYAIYTGRNQHLRRFETLLGAEGLDLEKIEVCERLANSTVLVVPGVARQLAINIRACMAHEYRTLASSTYYRDLRQRVGGQLWQLAHQTSDLDPLTCTMFPRGWEVPAGQLHTFDPEPRIDAVRSLINRCGGEAADGYIVAFIHGEFEPRRRVYPLHLHMLSSGGLRDVLDLVVRHTPTVRSIRNEYGVSDWVRQRFRMDRSLNCLPAPLTYLLKSYWPQKWQGYNAEGKLVRQRVGSRIDEPFHTEVLHWLDSHRLQDLTLLMNIAVGRDGFRLSDRAYTNGTK